jgi:hypothetical protein
MHVERNTEVSMSLLGCFSIENHQWITCVLPVYAIALLHAGYADKSSVEGLLG